MRNNNRFSWVGSKEHFIDEASVISLNHITLGRYGGNSKDGQTKNEDGCLIWQNTELNWEFIVLLDAHNTAESAELIIEEIEAQHDSLYRLLNFQLNEAYFSNVEAKLLKLFQSPSFLKKCRNVNGETACIIVIRKDNFIWWLSIGDCLLHVFHPDFSKFGQYLLNQRQFFEWIGEVNTFERAVPCFTVGVRELRKGKNEIVITTDGLVECPNDLYADSDQIYNVLYGNNHPLTLMKVFNDLKNNHIKDSTTVIAWQVNVENEATMPSNC